MARADPLGVACAFYGGAYAEVLRQYTGREYRILHPQCEARDDSLLAEQQLDAVERLLQGSPDSVVLVDEAYIDFGGETILPFLDAHRNLVIGRTFAKAYGLAALRAGCLIAHPGTLEPIRATLSPYNLNVAAAAALRAAIADRDWHDRYVRESSESRTLIYDFCDANGLPYYRSAANFVLVRVGAQAAAVTRALAEQGIFIRDRSNQPGCEGCVRITAGLTAHTERCLRALGDLL
mgnify:CR=1 FL=1